MKNCPTCHLTYPNEFTLCPHDGGTLQSKDEWANGTVVREKYRILGPIGAGGMATVYKAEHIHFHEVRALKVISAQLSGDSGFVRRFMQEAVLTRRLQHPNAVRVDDIDRGEDGRPFIVMEFIDGISLREAMKPQVPIPLERACRIAREVASALGAAHDLGMVHRDIKPSNLFLANIYSPETRPGSGQVIGEQAKVLDFGIAKIKESRMDDSSLRNLTMTGAGIYIGTPAYMSPEQAAGKRGDDLDGRADLYSLGVVLYQMLTGDLPLNADSEMQLMMAHLATEPVPIQQRLPNIPPPLAYLVMRSLAKEPSMRPASARAFVAEIEEIERSLAKRDLSAEVTVPAAAAPAAAARVAVPPAKAPFFTTTKIAALVALMVCALGLGAFTVISHFRNVSAAQAAQLLTPPPVNTAVTNPPADSTPVMPDPVPADNASETQAGKTGEDSGSNPLVDEPVVPLPIVSNQPVSKQPISKRPLVSAKAAPASDPSSGGFPSSVQKQPAPEQKQPTADPAAAANATLSQPAQPQGNDPWASSAGNQAGGMPPANNPGAGEIPGLGSGPANSPNPGLGNRPNGNDILRPAVVSKVEPKYSQEAKSFRYSGTTVLSVVVDEHGLPEDIRVLRAAGYGLDKQAVEAVSRWRFSPGLRNGSPIRYRIGVQVNFRWAGLFSFAKSSLFFQ